VLQGENVTLTCRVTYNGTNLMPLIMYWLILYPTTRRWIWRNTYVYPLNGSSVYQLTRTVARMDIVGSVHFRVRASSPRGLVVPGVQNQAWGWPKDNFWSAFVPQPVTSEIVVYMHFIVSVCIQ